MKSFTLSEVLITIGILAIVIVMTMPSVIRKYQQKIFITRIQKTYSIVNQALLLSEEENGPIKDWNFGNDYSTQNVKRVVEIYFKPYFKDVFNVTTYSLSGYSGGFGFILKDGTVFNFVLDGTSAGSDMQAPSVLWIFVNFKNKTLEKDLSTFNFSRDSFVMSLRPVSSGKLMLFNASPSTRREDLINHAVYGCNSSVAKNRRWACGALIMRDGWKITKDYPW